MTKRIGVFLLCVAGWALTSQAVVIHWATSGLASGATSAALVFIADGTPSYALGTLANGEQIDETVSGRAITPTGVGEQESTDAATRTTGAYYVVLFKTADGVTYYSSSSESLVYNDTSAITGDATVPADGVFTARSFSEWAAVPEPCGAALLAMGAAVLALRSRTRRALENPADEVSK
jgi:hypothetical protein